VDTLRDERGHGASRALDMRILHTSDWHLGHTLHGLTREYEHHRFLDWLVETLARERVDVLLVSGDVFDTANPGAVAQKNYYRFLARSHLAVPHLQVVVIAGNHDSALRLQAPREILETMHVHVVGEPRRSDGSLDLDQMVLPLRDRGGQIRAWCAAVPFLRPSDLGALEEHAPNGPSDALVDGVRRLYDEVLEDARGRRKDGQALIAMGHCFMVGTDVSRLSERKVLGGNQHALPVSIFGDDVDYVALGHLHKAQRVGGRDHVRYCGSPIPLSMFEGTYRHQACLVNFVDGIVADIRPLPIPRTVDIVRLPPSGAEPIDAVLGRIDELPALEDFEHHAVRPYLEVRVLLDKPVPDVRAQIEARLEGRGPRLVKITLDHPREREALADSEVQTVLQDLSPEQVFRSLYAMRHDGEVSAELLSAFHELVDDVRRQEEDRS
jgi:DNA repair protein SbcD/Mre11